MAKRVKPPNPSGLCMCGCGAPVRRAKLTNAPRLIFRGEFLRYIHGHAGRRQPPDNSYRRPVYMPSQETIAADKAEIQAAWTPAEEQKRIVDSRDKRKPAFPLVVNVTPSGGKSDT